MTPKDGELNTIRLALIAAGFFPHPNVKKTLMLSGDNNKEFDSILRICRDITSKKVELSVAPAGVLLEFYSRTV